MVYKKCLPAIFLVLCALIIWGAVVLTRRRRCGLNAPQGPRVSAGPRSPAAPLPEAGSSAQKGQTAKGVGGGFPVPEGAPVHSPKAVPLRTPAELLPDIDSLPPELPEHMREDLGTTLMMREAGWRGEDETIRSWPSYNICRDSLLEELSGRIDPGESTVSEIVQYARELHEAFWDAGGTSSPSAWKEIYSARALLEVTLERVPDDPVVVDALVETISDAYPMWRFDSEGCKKLRSNLYVRELLPLRRSQLEAASRHIDAGREPTWEDYVRGCDTAILLLMDGQVQQARSAVAWLESQVVGRGAVDPVYGEELRATARRFDRQSFLYNTRFRLYRDTKFPTRDEMIALRARYQMRRLPSFRGPDAEERGVVPKLQGLTEEQIQSFRDDIRYELTLND